MKVLVIQNNDKTPAALVGDHLQAAGAALDVVLPHDGGTLPATPLDHDGAVILGGPQHAGDDANFPAFPPMLDLLRQFHDQGKPLLGLCLGSQLLARTFGEKVRRHDVFEVGYPQIRITEAGRQDPLLAGLAPQQHILQWHEDTFDMPQGAVHLMQGDACHNQAFRYGRTTYGFQCHFEVSETLAKRWFDDWGHTIVRRYDETQGLRVLQQARDGIGKHGGRAAEFCRVVTERWGELVRQAYARRRGAAAQSQSLGIMPPRHHATRA